MQYGRAIIAVRCSSCRSKRTERKARHGSRHVERLASRFLPLQGWVKVGLRYGRGYGPSGCVVFGNPCTPRPVSGDLLPGRAQHLFTVPFFICGEHLPIQGGAGGFILEVAPKATTSLRGTEIVSGSLNNF